MSELQPRARPNYGDLLHQVRDAGLLEPRKGYYTIKIIFVGLGLMGGLVLFFTLGNSWLQIVTAAYLALMSGQAGTIAHDAGHSQISRSHRA